MPLPHPLLRGFPPPPTGSVKVGRTQSDAGTECSGGSQRIDSRLRMLPLCLGQRLDLCVVYLWLSLACSLTVLFWISVMGPGMSFSPRRMIEESRG